MSSRRMSLLLCVLLSFSLGTVAEAKRTYFEEDASVYTCIAATGTLGSQVQLENCASTATTRKLRMLVGQYGPPVVGNSIGTAITWTVTSNLTISQEMFIPYGALIQVASGVTLTISACVHAGPYPIFDADESTTGTVVLAFPNECQAYPYTWHNGAPSTLNRYELWGNGAVVFSIDATGIVSGGGGSTIVGAADTEVIFMDGTTAIGDSCFTYDQATGTTTTCGGYVSSCDPTTDADRCDDKAVKDTLSPTSPATGGCDFKFVDTGTDTRLEYICDTYSLQAVQREPYTTVSTAATVTLTNEQCWRATVVNSDADAMTVNLCATPRLGSLVCVFNTAAGALTVAPDAADAIQEDGTTLSAGTGVTSAASANVEACFFAVTTGLWKMSKGPW